MQVEVLLADLNQLISSHKKEEILELCLKNQELIRDNSFEVLEFIIGYVNEHTQAENLVKFELMIGLLEQVSNICNYDDVLLALHKEMADTEDDVKFTNLLQPLKTALLEVPESKFKFAIWCFNAIQTFISTLPAPESLNMEEQERLVHVHNEIDYDVCRILTIYGKVINLYEAIMPKFATTANGFIVEKYLLQLLGKPLCYLDMGLNTSGYPITERIVKLLVNNSNPLKYLTWLKFKQLHEDDIKVERLALANYFYLILGLKLSHELVPQVYDGIYIFQHILYYLTELFTYDHQFISDKGLVLAESTFVHTNCLPHQLLDDDIHSKFTEQLSKVIIYSPLKSQRQKALGIFRKYILAFNQHGKYLVIHNAFKLVNHSGLMGYLITLYKDLLVEQFNKFEEQQTLDTYFKGAKLATLLMQFCHLHKKEESDMLELADQIIPTLNFLRYLVIKDRTDATGIRGLLPEIETVFMEPLKKGLVLSKAHYKLKIQDLQEEAANGDKREVSQVSVTIAGRDLAHMSVMEKMQVLHASMTAFDVMESILARLVECIENVQSSS